MENRLVHQPESQSDERVVRLQVKHVYGKLLAYPVGETANLFLKLTGKKTLDMKDVQIIKELGFRIEQVMPESLF